MGLFMDGDGIPLAFSLFPGNSNEQTSLKILEQKILGTFGCQKFIYCSDAGLASESIRAYIVTQSIKKLPTHDKAWALSGQGFKLDDDVSAILKVSEGRWQIEECFRIMKTDFAARPVCLHNENRIKAHFLIYFLALLLYRLLEKRLDYNYTCKGILDTLKAMNFCID